MNYFTEQEVEILQQVYQLFQNSDNWTCGAMARDKMGEVCSIYNRDASSWCLIGAVLKFIDHSSISREFLFDKLLSIVTSIFPYCRQLNNCNDYLGREKVLELLKDCINNKSI